MKVRTFSLFLLLLISALQHTTTYAQAGITINTGKLFYAILPGGNGSQSIKIQNPTDRDLEVGVSMSDWDYDSLGNNQTFDANTLNNSCANWIKILPDAYFILKPHETKELTVTLAVPSDLNTKIPVHTAMIYFTQLNPMNESTSNGAALKVTVRMGVKVYHSTVKDPEKNMEILAFNEIKTDKLQKHANALKLLVSNTGQGWINGTVKIELLNMGTGEKENLPAFDFYSLPGDRTYLDALLPLKIKPGKYTATAIINYGDKSELKVAELEFAL